MSLNEKVDSYFAGCVELHKIFWSDGAVRSKPIYGGVFGSGEFSLGSA